ncbi:MULTISPECIES: hypothetical protein [unclassified Streptomyces]|uniref:hypothetical protein n=1 Tax=unclassified Streptomyces TaxID=2593676 RepID=UPI003318EA4F
MIAGIGLCAFGILGMVWGARHAFNLRGATDRLLARGREARAFTAARRGELDLAPAGPPAWALRLRAGAVLACGPLLVLVGLVVAFD